MRCSFGVVVGCFLSVHVFLEFCLALMMMSYERRGGGVNPCSRGAATPLLGTRRGEGILFRRQKIRVVRIYGVVDQAYARYGSYRRYKKMDTAAAVVVAAAAVPR